MFLFISNSELEWVIKWKILFIIMNKIYIKNKFKLKIGKFFKYKS